MKIPQCLFLSPADAAPLLGVSTKTVLRLIRAGRLRAVDRGAGKTPIYGIEPDAIDEFKCRREVSQPTPARAKRQHARSVPDFF